MPVTAADIKIFGSGTNNRGGVKSSTEIPNGQLHALFDPVRAAEALTGMTDYRCVYVQNDNAASTLRDAVAYVSNAPNTTGVSVMLGAGAAAIDGMEPDVATETIAPLGVTFTVANNAANAIAVGSLTPGQSKAIWIQRTIAANTASAANDQFTLLIVGETA